MSGAKREDEFPIITYTDLSETYEENTSLIDLNNDSIVFYRAALQLKLNLLHN